MPGARLQMSIANAQQEIILNGNPLKTFFRTTYSKYTNFAMQRFRIDFEGNPTPHLSETSSYVFKIKRYADLLMDSYLSFTLPHVWSPIRPPTSSNSNSPEVLKNLLEWAPYEFKWIDFLGAIMIKEIEITCGNQTLQKYSGEYILSCAHRDLTGEKKDLFNEMIGHIPEIRDPGNSGARVNAYPNAFYTTNPAGAEPSIRGKKLLIPLNAFFCLNSQKAFPLVALQYNELEIKITLRPIQELFRIRDVTDLVHRFPYIAPNFNVQEFQLYQFLQTPPSVMLNADSYEDKRATWNADIHLVCTYCFLSMDEARLFAMQEQSYLIKQIREYSFHNFFGTGRVRLDSYGLVPTYVFYFRRSDANLRNEWTNFTNFPYSYLPVDLAMASSQGGFPVMRVRPNGVRDYAEIGPGVNIDGRPTGYFITGDFAPENQMDILQTMAIYLNGEYRENNLNVDIYRYMEHYMRIIGNPCSSLPGLMSYNYCLSSSNSDMQPSGAISHTSYKRIEMEFELISPPLDINAQTLTICDPLTNTPCGINKGDWAIFKYTYDMRIFEEYYNILKFTNGNCGMMYQ